MPQPMAGLTAAPQELLRRGRRPPSRRWLPWWGASISSVWDKYTSIDETMAENESLKEENAELRRQMVDYDKMKAENEAFKNLARHPGG